MICTTDNIEPVVYTDENGNCWDYVADDMGGCIMVQHETEDRAAVLKVTHGIYELIPVDDGYTFGINTTEEFIVRSGRWVEND